MSKIKFIKVKKLELYCIKTVLFMFPILGYYYEIPSIGAIRINTQVSMSAKYAVVTQRSRVISVLNYFLR